MTTICGHERESLRSRLIASQLRDEGLDIDGVLECHLNILMDSVSDSSLLRHHAVSCAAIDVDIHDPAKLAEMLAHEGRRLGFDVPGQHDQTFWHQLVIEPQRKEQVIEVDAPEDGPSLKLTMPQARAILLQWLQLPDGAREGAERALRGES